MLDNMIGPIAGLFGVSGFAFQLYKMIRTKEIRTISYNLSIFTGVAMSMWMLYGVEKSDPVIYVPNVVLLGILVGMFGYKVYGEKVVSLERVEKI